MNNLILIGNGFDLAHGLKTSYNHFIATLMCTYCKDPNCYSDLFSTYGIANRLEDLIGSAKFNSINNKKSISNILVHNFITEIHLHNWCDIEQLYFLLLNEVGLKNKLYSNKLIYKSISKLNDDFETLKNYLHNYLKDQEQYAESIESYSNLFSTLDSPHTLILNFNYTHTIENIYKSEIKKSKIIHMHGELDSADNPIVFGYAADHDESRELSNKNDNEYLRNIKKHLYKRADNESQLSKYLMNTKDIDVSILGHSCGLSDKLILNQILNNENVRSIRYFYYKEYEYYFDAIVNIDRIMKNDDEFRERIINFKESFRMPQHDDYNDDLNEFVNYIKNIKEDQNTRYDKRYPQKKDITVTIPKLQ